MIKLLADENIESEIVETLRENGFEVDYVAEFSPNINDKSILQLANKKKSILITSDKDFGELVFRQKLIHSGVILLRLMGESPKRKNEIVLDVLKKHESVLQNSFSVITQTSIRIRQRIN